MFLAISTYFKDNLKRLFNKYKINRQTVSFIFVVPNDWTGILDTLNHLIFSLFEKAGHLLPTKEITFITEMEAFITYQQLGNSGKNDIPKYFQPENRCVMYDISANKNSLTVAPVYFQFKQDDSLKVYNDNRYVTPKILKMYDPRHFTIPVHRAALKELILWDILKLKKRLANNVTLPTWYSNHEDVEELLVFQIMELVKVNNYHFEFAMILILYKT